MKMNALEEFYIKSDTWVVKLNGIHLFVTTGKGPIINEILIRLLTYLIVALEAMLTNQ